jgi:autotransporter passenger strand-loop-strand repeat protein
MPMLYINRVQTDLAAAGKDTDAMIAAWDKGLAAALGIGIKFGLKAVIQVVATRIAASGATAVLGFAAEGAIGEYAVALAIGAGVVSAPVVIGLAAAFVAGVAFDAYYEQNWSEPVNSWTENWIATHNPTILLNSNSTIAPGQTGSNILIAGGGSLSVLGGGTANGIVVNSGGAENVYGVDAGAVLNDGGYQYVFGTATYAVALDPGIQVVVSGGLAISATLLGGEQDVYGTASSTDVESGGVQIVESGGTAIDSVINAGGTLELLSGAGETGATFNSGQTTA